MPDLNELASRQWLKGICNFFVIQRFDWRDHALFQHLFAGLDRQIGWQPFR